MVPELALGTVELGMVYGIAKPGQPAQIERADAEALVRMAIDSGMNCIDTAPGYGTSEEIIGNALAGQRDTVILATKVSSHDLNGERVAPGLLGEHIRNSIEASLRRLKTDWIDLVQVHNWEREAGNSEEMFEALFEARSKGWIRCLGATVYGVENALAAMETGRLQALQVAYSVLDRRMEENVLPRARTLGVGIIARSLLLKGVLTSRSEFLPEALGELKERSRAFQALCREFFPDTPFQAIAIAFGLNNRMVDSVLVGVSSRSELEQDLAAVKLRTLPVEFADKLEALKIDDPNLLNPASWGIP